MKSTLLKVILVSALILFIIAGALLFFLDDEKKSFNEKNPQEQQPTPVVVREDDTIQIPHNDTQQSENNNAFVQPQSVLYVGNDAAGTGTLFSSEFREMIDHCRSTVMLEAGSEYAKILNPQLDGIEPIRAILTDDCAYHVANRFYQGDIPTITLQKIAEGERETFSVLGSAWKPYYSYGGKLYYATTTVPADPLSFKDGYGFCQKYFIVDGRVVINEKKTQIPESVCGENSPLKATLKTIDDSSLYKGETEAYLFAGESADATNLETVIVPLSNLNVSTVKEVGRYGNTFFFTDGEKVISIFLDMMDPPTRVHVEVLTIADPKSFEALSAMYTRDNSSVYFNGEKMNDVDRDTFTVLKNSYGKDKNAAYYSGRILTGAEPESFGVVFDYDGGFESQSVHMARDGSGLWYEDQKMIGAPLTKTLHLVPKGKWTDPNIYIIEGERIVAYNDRAILSSKIPSGFLNAIETKDYPQNIKLIENRYTGVQCNTEDPNWYYGSFEDNDVNNGIFTVLGEELKAYCEAISLP